MKLGKCFRATVWMLCSFGLVTGNQAVFAAGPDGVPAAKAVVEVNDIELAKGGVLAGRVVDARGVPVADAEVAIASGSRAIAKVRSGKQGQFQFAGLRGGTHQIVIKDGVVVSRLWAANTAPPNSKRSILLVSGGDVIAAQHAPLKVWLADPLVMAGIVAIAVAVPVAIATSRDSGS